MRRLFEFSFYARNVGLVVASGLALAVALAVAIRWGARHVSGLALPVLQGLRVLRSPITFVRVVAVPAWRLGATGRDRVRVARGVWDPRLDQGRDPRARGRFGRSAVPFTPGGAGAQQGLVVLALGGAATSTQTSRSRQRGLRDHQRPARPERARAVVGLRAVRRLRDRHACGQRCLARPPRRLTLVLCGGGGVASRVAGPGLLLRARNSVSRCKSFRPVGRSSRAAGARRSRGTIRALRAASRVPAG